MDKKQSAGIAAASLVTNGMTVGLGTGSTVLHVIKELKRRRDDEGLEFIAVPSSFPTRLLCIENGFEYRDLCDVDKLDIAFDGCDRVDDNLNVIKGGGAAQTVEKVFACMADKFVIVADDSKYVRTLSGDVDVPVEVIECAWRSVQASLDKLGYESKLRNAGKKDGLVITDNGNIVLDIRLKGDEDLLALNNAVTLLPGVLEIGIFIGIASCAYVGTDDGCKIIYKNLH